MSYRLLITCGILVTLTLFGCSPSEEKPAPAPEQQTTQAEKPAMEQAEEAAQAVAEKVEKMGEQAEATSEEAAEAIREGADQAAEKTEEAMAEAEATAAEAAKSMEEMADQAASKTEEQVDKAGVAASTAVAETANAAKSAVTPESLVLQASYGNITFPHGMHADAYDCATCHGEGTPGLFGLSKDVAHKLCKDCHKQEGGPTACTGCHTK